MVTEIPTRAAATQREHQVSPALILSADTTHTLTRNYTPTPRGGAHAHTEHSRPLSKPILRRGSNHTYNALTRKYILPLMYVENVILGQPNIIC